MRYAISSPSLGEYGEPRLLAELAQEAEAVGWDGFFIWDDITWPSKDPVIDPWVALAAMAMTTMGAANLAHNTAARFRSARPPQTRHASRANSGNMNAMGVLVIVAKPRHRPARIGRFAPRAHHV